MLLTKHFVYILRCVCRCSTAPHHSRDCRADIDKRFSVWKLLQRVHSKKVVLLKDFVLFLTQHQINNGCKDNRDTSRRDTLYMAPICCTSALSIVDHHDALPQGLRDLWCRQHAVQRIHCHRRLRNCVQNKARHRVGTCGGK